jgi:uncharacterized protein (TIGR02996 family)
MADRAFFLAAIRADPDDDVVRLVFADWLEENGDSERAEFIRVQCELARLPAYEPRAIDLHWRQEELLAAHGDCWRAEVPKWARRGCTFRRGFVNRVEATVTQFIRSGNALSMTVPVREVTLSAAPQRIAELAACPHLTRLKALGFRHVPRTGHGIGDAGAAALAASPHLARLTDLELVAPRAGAAGAAALAGSQNLTELRRLALTRNHLGDAGVESFIAALRHDKLASLELGYNRIGDEGVERIARCPHLAGLRELNLEYNEIGNAGVAALANSPFLSGLLKLNLRGNNVGEAGLRALATSPYFRYNFELTWSSPPRSPP